MADTALVHERMVRLGEQLVELGYEGPQEVIEGNGPIGLACRECRSGESAYLLACYFKDLHNTFKTRSPDPEGNKDRAVAAVVAAYQGVKAALSDGPDEPIDAPSSRPNGTVNVNRTPGAPLPNGRKAVFAPRPNLPSARPGMPAPAVKFGAPVRRL